MEYKLLQFLSRVFPPPLADLFHSNYQFLLCLNTDPDHQMNDPLHNHVRCTDCYIIGGVFEIYIEPIRLKAYQDIV